MKPVDQTKFLKNGQRGNCLAACLASIFELDITLVPALEELPPRSNWRNSLKEWALNHKFIMIEVLPNDFNGWHYIAVGLTEKGCRHAVVGHQGSIVHDPHHFRKGLVEIKSLFIFEPI